MPSRLQPALIGGVFVGVLSALPFINIANCCCIWWLGGGAIAAYLLQQSTPQPIAASDGALVGLMAGLTGAFVWTVVSVPINLMMGPFQRAMFERMLSSRADMPEQARQIIENMGSGGSMAIGLVMGFGFMLVMGTIFTTLGGVLGAVMFQKKTPPPEVGPS